MDHSQCKYRQRDAEWTDGSQMLPRITPPSSARDTKGTAESSAFSQQNMIEYLQLRAGLWEIWEDASFLCTKKNPKPDNLSTFELSFHCAVSSLSRGLFLQTPQPHQYQMTSGSMTSTSQTLMKAASRFPLLAPVLLPSGKIRTLPRTDSNSTKG